MSANGIPAKPPKANLPNQTLYVTNLNDKIRKADLRRALYTLFSTHGVVLDVVALKTMKMRGQAHIVFQNPSIATQAMRALQGFELFDREMQISYAKGKSNMVSRLDGTAKVPEAFRDAAVASEPQKSTFGTAPTEKSAFGTVSAPEAAETNGADDKADTRGVKRPREDDADQGEASMDEEEDAAMDVSDSD